MGVAVPELLIGDCVRLCCSLCLLENTPEVVSPDDLVHDRAKFEASGDHRYIEAHRCGKVGWDGGHSEVTRAGQVSPNPALPHGLARSRLTQKRYLCEGARGWIVARDIPARLEGTNSRH
jgi:hypothetical protein